MTTIAWVTFILFITVVASSGLRCEALIPLSGFATTAARQLTMPTTTSTTAATASASTESVKQRRRIPLYISLQQDQQQDENVMYVRSYLQQYYPIWLSMMELNDDVWKSMGDTTADGGGIGFTLFVLSDDTLRNSLSAARQEQLFDPRNLETTQKMVAYHVISEVVSGEQLFNAGGVITVGGEVPIERSRSGGLFGLIGGQEDGRVTINQSQVLQTDIQVGTGLIHEVDSMVSPSILWRYMDQLRIPGSK